jgi:hypothetical protein
MSNQPALFPMPQQGNTSDDYWTPKWVFDALGVKFDLDVACPPGGPPHTPAKAWYTQETDGLASPWYGNVWMNPPFSKCAPWAWKFMQHRHGIALTAVSNSKWHDALWEDADAVLLLPYNFKFDQGAIFIRTGLTAYGEENVEALRRSNLGKVR